MRRGAEKSMSRPSKPAALIEAEGNTNHRTKAELEYRKNAEKALYTGEKFKEINQVKNNPIAHKEFLRLKRLYSKVSFMDALDQQIINRYCLEVANVQKLQDLAEKMEKKIDDCEELDAGKLVQLYKSISGIHAQIQSCKNLLLKYEDRLFLNPMGRIKSIPKKPPKDEKKGGINTFMAKREQAKKESLKREVE